MGGERGVRLMAHRAKHLNVALKRRVLAGRMIKTDQTPVGNTLYELARLTFSDEDKAISFMRARLHTQRVADKMRARRTDWRTRAGVKVSRTVLPVSAFLSAPRR